MTTVSHTTPQAASPSPEQPLLRIDNLRTYFETPAGTAKAVDGVSLAVSAGETVCIVGESGSGKSVTALSVLRLIQSPGVILPDSEITFEGVNLLSLGDEPLRAIRGRRIGMIFQEPMTALNPVLTVGEQIAEVVRVHEKVSRADAWKRAVEMLALTGIPDAESRAKAYPHQLSGGMRQRVMIAIAIVMHPSLIIADEPTTALDVTIQAQILTLLRDLQTRLGSAILLITHDFGVVAEMADRVIVMYGGEVVESTTVQQLFDTPHHPYTRGLMQAMPHLQQLQNENLSGHVSDETVRTPLYTIPGTVPPSTAWPHGCRFRDRCASAWERCAAEHPPLYRVDDAHHSRCHLAEEPDRRVSEVAPTMTSSNA